MLGPQVGSWNYWEKEPEAAAIMVWDHFFPVFSAELSVPTVQAEIRKFDTAHAAVVSSTAWAARLFSVTSAQSWKFWIQMLIFWFPLCSSQVLFKCDLKRIQFPHISTGQAGDTLDLKNSTTTTRRELLVDRHLDKEFWSNQCSTKRCSDLFGQIFATKNMTWAPKM